MNLTLSLPSGRAEWEDGFFVWTSATPNITHDDNKGKVWGSRISVKEPQWENRMQLTFWVSNNLESSRVSRWQNIFGKRWIQGSSSSVENSRVFKDLKWAFSSSRVFKDLCKPCVVKKSGSSQNVTNSCVESRCVFKSQNYCLFLWHPNLGKSTSCSA